MFHRGKLFGGSVRNFNFRFVIWAYTPFVAVPPEGFHGRGPGWGGEGSSAPLANSASSLSSPKKGTKCSFDCWLVPSQADQACLPGAVEVLWSLTRVWIFMANGMAMHSRDPCVVFMCE